MADYWIGIGIGGALVLALIALVLALYNYQQGKKRSHEMLTLIQAVRNETQAMGSGSIGVGQRLLEVEKRLNLTVEKQMELEQKDPGSLPYVYAVRLVEMGASADDLVESCGLARVEAELIELVHREMKQGPEEETYGMAETA